MFSTAIRNTSATEIRTKILAQAVLGYSSTGQGTTLTSRYLLDKEPGQSCPSSGFPLAKPFLGERIEADQDQVQVVAIWMQNRMLAKVPRFGLQADPV